MTVNELIEKLKTMPQEARIRVIGIGWYADPQIEEIDKRMGFVIIPKQHGTLNQIEYQILC